MLDTFVTLMQEATENGISDSWEGELPCAECDEHGHDESCFSYNDGASGQYRVTYCASHEPGAGEIGEWLCDEHLITQAVERDVLARDVVFGDEPGECLMELEDHVLFAKLRDRLFDVANARVIGERLQANGRVCALVRGALERARKGAL